MTRTVRRNRGEATIAFEKRKPDISRWPLPML